MINFFQAIKTAFFYRENAFEMFKRNLNMFLDLQRSGGQNKIKAKKKKLLWSQIFARVAR